MNPVPPDPAPQPRAALAWTVLGGVLFVVAAGAIRSVGFAVVVLAALCLAGAVARVAFPESLGFTVRRRLVDVSTLLIFALGFAYLGITAILD